MNTSMEERNRKNKIEAFWEWFVDNEETIKKFFSADSEVDQKALTEGMDNLILALGRFAWEISQGAGSTYHLTISPNGDPENLKVSQRIVAAAPDLPHWKFFPAKQPKDWGFRFTIYDDFMLEREVDASGWQYLLVKEDGGKVDVILEAGNIGWLDKENQLVAGDLVITNILGEEQKIRHIRKIHVVPELMEHQRQRSRALEEMKGEFDQ